MRISAVFAAASLAAVCCGAAPIAASQEITAARPAPGQTAPATQVAPEDRPAVDPAAIAALERMSAYLRSLQSFEARTATTMDMITEVTPGEEQKLQFAGTGLYRVRRPNSFFVEQRTDRRQRQYYYDGTNLTVYAPRMHYYAQVAAPATIAETVILLEERYNISLPLSDLFTWGTSAADTANMVTAQHIGFARIGEDECDHYAFRQGELDWQIWIRRGDQPLPRKVVITTREMEGQPQFTSELTWTLNPRFEDTVFTFTPSSEARRIQIADNPASEE
jgi:hypothetical protein